MANEIDVLAVLGGCRMETATVANKAGVPLSVARRALRRAEESGIVTGAIGDGRFWRRGAANPIIWRATQGDPTNGK